MTADPMAAAKGELMETTWEYEMASPTVAQMVEWMAVTMVA